MSVEEKLAKNAAPHLRPGEQVQHVLFGQTRSVAWLVAGALLLYPLLFVFLFGNRYLSIVVTDQRILICDSGRWSGTNAKEVLAELPRDTVLGPWSGTIWARIEVDGRVLHFHRRFRDRIEALGRTRVRAA